MKNNELPCCRSAYIVGSKMQEGSLSTPAADQKSCMLLDTIHGNIHTNIASINTFITFHTI